MDYATMVTVVMTIQGMEERGIFVKDHTIEDAIQLVEFNSIVDKELMMNKKLEELK